MEQKKLIERLTAENERLREALEDCVDDFGEDYCVSPEVKQRAINALSLEHLQEKAKPISSTELIAKLDDPRIRDAIGMKTRFT